MEKAYISNLKFGITQWQVWFVGEDNSEAQSKWEDALKTLNNVGDSCSEPQEFFEKAIAHFERFGFIRIAK